ncbi:MAG: hypothetical protein KDI22_13280 [Gammaproteobacteria bacterium]|nr:hypothetical protein [Gammaproteobacteria bacterium]MCP5316759.1 hypothetical protein [Chromatiaceae bacterium]MCW5585558.1 hypothetical protein [Chromatiales bacterium]MCB1817355.1 hypothetical protein [Gammaproteobacteria bacterium]MCP5428946.1 hypothetical protein [Chromatiaceae bacterium]
MRLPEVALVLAGMGTHAAIGGEAYAELARLYDYPATLERDAVPVCFGHGCSSVQRITLQTADWQQVTRAFALPAADAAAEREQIRDAIAEMENVAGRLAGTADDRAGDISGFGVLRPQLDCIDESSNTTTYLTLLEQAGLLKWHSVQPTVRRGYFFVGGWPHYSALLRENGSGALWVVDSWFRDNGQLPDVVDLEAWQDGWKPVGFVF